MGISAAPIERISAAAFRVPTTEPESDGTLEWDSTTLVIAEITGGAETGLGYSYADASAASMILTLGRAFVGLDGVDVPVCWTAVTVVLRNNGRPGVASAALSAIDAALWDLKGRLLGLRRHPARRRARHRARVRQRRIHVVLDR
jgi:L-alanine-DL-glutamate epimerase-like enolase superfamily enzyme